MILSKRTDYGIFVWTERDVVREQTFALPIGVPQKNSGTCTSPGSHSHYWGLNQNKIQSLDPKNAHVSRCHKRIYVQRRASAPRKRWQKTINDIVSPK